MVGNYPFVITSDNTVLDVMYFNRTISADGTDDGTVVYAVKIGIIT